MRLAWEKLMVKNYRVMLLTPIVVTVEAQSEDEVEKKVLESLINTKQIKPSDPVEIKIIEELNA